MTFRGPRSAVVLLAAGEGRRVGAGVNKVLLPLAGAPVLAWSVRAVASIEYVDQVIVVTREQDIALVEATVREAAPELNAHVIAGEATRSGSEWNALRALAFPIERGDIEVVAIHDTARPLAGESLFRTVLEVAAEHGGAVPGCRARALVPVVGAGGPDAGAAAPSCAPGEHSGPDKSSAASGSSSLDLVRVQTPQAFRAVALLGAYQRAADDGFAGTDTASCVARYTDVDIRWVHSDATNLKITFPEDVAVAEHLLLQVPVGSGVSTSAAPRSALPRSAPPGSAVPRPADAASNRRAE